jgi:phosphoesterase RecJ-like protein
MALLLRALGAEAHLFSSGPFRRPEIEDCQPLFEPRIPPALLAEARTQNNTGVLIMDCSTLDRIGPELRRDTGWLLPQDGPEGNAERLPLGVIDHHASGEDFGQVRWVLPLSPSTTLLVYSLFGTLGVEMDASVAEPLFLGLATDTGFFRHLTREADKVFAAAADMAGAGVNPNAVFFKMNGGRSLGSRRLAGRLLDRAEPRLNGKVLLTWAPLAEWKEFGAENWDSDTVFLNLQTVRGCEAVVLIREEEPGRFSVGLRANGGLNVGEIARRRGGGGHPKAAGYNSSQDREAILADLLGEMETFLSR